MTRGYVLITTEVGKASEVVERLRHMPGVMLVMSSRARTTSWPFWRGRIPPPWGSSCSMSSTAPRGSQTPPR
jgi:hypothetical protein